MQIHRDDSAPASDQELFIARLGDDDMGVCTLDELLALCGEGVLPASEELTFHQIARVA